MGVDWWDAVGCTQSAAEDGIGIVAYILWYSGYCFVKIFFGLVCDVEERVGNLNLYVLF